MGKITEILNAAQQRAKDLNLPYQGAVTPEEAYELMQKAPGAKIVDLCRKLGVACTVLDQRFKPCYLVLRLEYCFMRAVEIVEVVDQCIDPGVHVECFQHMAKAMVGLFFTITKALEDPGLDFSAVNTNGTAG